MILVFQMTIIHLLLKYFKRAIRVTILDLLIGETKLKMIMAEEEAIKYDTGQEIKVKFNVNNSYLFSSETGVSAISN